MAQRDYTITGPDGSDLTITGPDNATPEQLRTAAQAAYRIKQGQPKPYQHSASSTQDGKSVPLRDLGAGVMRGGFDVARTLTMPIGYLIDKVKGDRVPNTEALITGKMPLSRNDEFKQASDADFLEMTNRLGVDQKSPLFTGGRIGGNILATAGVGPAMAARAASVPFLSKNAAPIIDAVRTGGMSAGGAKGVNALAARTAGGAITGGATAGLIDPDSAGAGALIGGALPGGLQAAGYAGKLVAKGSKAATRAAVGSVSPEVAALADRAEQLGINVPADRLVDSKPLNALAATLNYLPFSGRAGTEANMAKQLDTALSRTFGQNTDNVTQGLRNASSALGSEFDRVLQSNTVKITPAFKSALQTAENQATNELGAEGAGIIQKQIADILTKGASGEIDGQAAYNIKKTLDRIGNRNSPEAFYARDLKKSLMNALNDSLGPQEAQAFAKTRQQYGNMLALEGLAQNGAEGGVSIGRLANMKNINNRDLQELADISAQFLKTRENPHGALQRLVLGGLAGATGGAAAVPYLAGGAVAGRGANALLNSNSVRSTLLGRNAGTNALQTLLANNPGLVQAGYRSVPALAGDR